MWISYAGRDSSDLVEAVVAELQSRYPDLPVNRYKKRVSVAHLSSFEAASAVGEQAQDDWPVIEQDQGGSKDLSDYDSQEKYHLLPMAELFELVVEIAFSTRVLVILSPAYFQSEPCLQELAAIISLETRSMPLFVLNGITHEELRSGKIATLSDQNPQNEPSTNIPHELVRVRQACLEMNEVGSFTELTIDLVENYLQRILKRNVPAIDIDPASKGIVSQQPDASPDLDKLQPSEQQAINDIVDAVHECYVAEPGFSGYSQALQKADIKRFSEWFETKFGKALLDQLNSQQDEKVSADVLVQKLMRNPGEVHHKILDALMIMNEGRADASVQHLGKFKDNDVWNAGISELAGLYSLVLLDHECLESLRGSECSDLCFVNFSTTEFQVRFQACIVNSSVQDSIMRIRPVDGDNTSGAPKTSDFNLFENDVSASDDKGTSAREFVEALFMHVTKKSVQDCPGSDANHPTGMNESERRSLRGKVHRYKRQLGQGSLVIPINRADISNNRSWWTDWEEVHEALNDGAAAHAQIRLRGIVISQRDGSATITMHKDYEERLEYIHELLDEYYVT